MENLEKQPVEIIHVGIQTGDGTGYIMLKCGERIRTLYFDGKCEIKDHELGGKQISFRVEKTELGNLGTKNSWFPPDSPKNKEFYPKKWGVLDLFGMGMGVK